METQDTKEKFSFREELGVLRRNGGRGKNGKKEEGTQMPPPKVTRRDMGDLL